jgi:hypothetical protein
MQPRVVGLSFVGTIDGNDDNFLPFFQVLGKKFSKKMSWGSTVGILYARLDLKFGCELTGLVFKKSLHKIVSVK